MRSYFGTTFCRLHPGIAHMILAAMLFNRRKLLAIILFVVAIPVLLWTILVMTGAAPEPGQPMFPPFNLSDRLSKVPVEETPEGLRVEYEDASYSPEEFLRELRARQGNNRGWSYMFTVLDITNWTSIAWVLFGLAGQALFMGRMLVQWLASEKARMSIVPPAFWWFSLIGSTMLMIYFIWRKEIVGFLGQSTGWAIYVRNLWFIYGKRREADH